MRKTVRAGQGSETGRNPEAIKPSRQSTGTTRRIPNPMAISRDSSRRLSRGFARARVGWDGVKESVSPESAVVALTDFQCTCRLKIRCQAERTQQPIRDAALG